MKQWIAILSAVIMMVTVSMAQENYPAANESEINSSALKAILLNSETKPETYVFTLDMDQRIEITNITEDNRTESQTISARSFGVAALNLTARAMRITAASLSMQDGQEENASAVATDIYLLNDTLYMNVDGNWTKITLAGLSLEGLWKQENAVGQQMEEINNSTVAFLGYENVNGIDCYKIEVVPDLKAYSALPENQLGTSVTGASLNLSTLFNKTNISEITWISRDTYLPVRTAVLMNMTVSPEELGLPPKKTGMLEMRIDTAETMEFSGFNRSVNITLPDDARKAAAFPLPISALMNSTSMNSTSMNSPSMNSTSMNSTSMNSTSMNSTSTNSIIQ